MTSKDIVSSRFKGNRDSEDKIEEVGLNKVTEELRKLQVNIFQEAANKKLLLSNRS